MIRLTGNISSKKHGSNASICSSECLRPLHLLAVFFVRKASQKKCKDTNDEKGLEGMSIGLCFGVALSTALHINVGLGMVAGMVLGYAIGSLTEKDRED